MTKSRAHHAQVRRVGLTYSKPKEASPSPKPKWKPRGPTPGSKASPPRGHSHLKAPSTHRKPPKYNFSGEDLRAFAKKGVDAEQRKNKPKAPPADHSGKWFRKKTQRWEDKKETVAPGNPRLKKAEPWSKPEWPDKKKTDYTPKKQLSKRDRYYADKKRAERGVIFAKKKHK